MFLKCCKKKMKKNISLEKLIINNKLLLSIDHFDLFSEECSICLEPLIKDTCMYSYNCSHIFHFNCLMNFLQNKKDKNQELYCPICYENQDNLFN